jgi:hypothetical protein
MHPFIGTSQVEISNIAMAIMFRVYWHFEKADG